MKTCTTICDKCKKKSGMLQPIEAFDIGLSNGAYHLNWKYRIEKDLCGSCRHELEDIIKGFFK